MQSSNESWDIERKSWLKKLEDYELIIKGSVSKTDANALDEKIELMSERTNKSIEQILSEKFKNEQEVFAQHLKEVKIEVSEKIESQQIEIKKLRIVNFVCLALLAIVLISAIFRILS